VDAFRLPRWLALLAMVVVTVGKLTPARADFTSRSKFQNTTNLLILHGTAVI
jgi:hypothetical protein